MYPYFRIQNYMGNSLEKNIVSRDFISSHVHSFSLGHRHKRSYHYFSVQHKLSGSYHVGKSIVAKLLNGNKKYNYCSNHDRCHLVVYRNKLCYNHYYIKYLRVSSPYRKSRRFINSSRSTHMTLANSLVKGIKIIK